MRAVASLVLALALVGTGCVSSDKYAKKETEAAQFRQHWEDEVAKGAVDREKAALQAKELQEQVDALKEKVRASEATLTQKETELRAGRDRIAEQQALVDELSKSKRKLEAAKAELEKKSGEYEQLAQSLRSEIDAGRVELMELRGKTTVKMKDKILFASGSSIIGADGKGALRKVAQALRGLSGKSIRVEGHTDNVPTSPGGPFPTNWELSTARALAVVRFLQDSGVDATRLSGAGFGEFQPVAANDTPDSRSLNRRIEIVLAPIEGAVAAPVAPARGAGKASKM